MKFRFRRTESLLGSSDAARWEQRITRSIPTWAHRSHLRSLGLATRQILERASVSGAKPRLPLNCDTRTSRLYFTLARLRPVSVFTQWSWWKAKRWKLAYVGTDCCQCWLRWTSPNRLRVP